jgi:hypothetical protein
MNEMANGEVSMGWEIESDFDPEGSGWATEVKATIPRIEEDERFLLHKLSRDMASLRDAIGARGS